MITKSHYQKYISKGWSVFPVRFYRDRDGKIVKQPAVEWKQYQTRLATADEIEDWDGRYSGIGLATGQFSRIVVVDVDEDKQFDFIKSPVVARSAFSGGRHYFYRATEQTKNAVKIEGLPIDFRGDGGYIVLPPSTFEGKKYTWEKTVDLMFLPDLPKEITKKLETKSYKKPAISITSDLPEAYEGGRNDTATKVAGTLLNRIQPTMWEIAGWPALLHWNTYKCNPPLNEIELRTVFDSIKTTHTQNHPDDFEIYKGSEALKKHNQMLSEWGSGLSTTFTEIDDFFTFLPQHLYLLSGATHQGKTQVALNLASRMATLYRVMFASLEMGVFITPKVEKIVDGAYPENLSILTSNKMLTVKKLIEVVQSMKEKPQIIFIDHIHFFERNGESMASEIEKIILHLQNASKELEVPILLIAHVRKLNENREPTMDDLKDSSALAQVPSVVMQIYRKRNKFDENDPNKSYYSDESFLMIQKNRIGGKTGVLGYKLQNEVMRFGIITKKPKYEYGLGIPEWAK